MYMYNSTMNFYNVQCTKQAASWHQTWANCSRLWSKAVYLSVPIMSRWISLKSLYLRSGHTNSNSRTTTINLFKTMAPTRNWDILRLLGFKKSIFWNTMTQNRVFGPNNTKYWTLQDPPPPWVLTHPTYDEPECDCTTSSSAFFPSANGLDVSVQQPNFPRTLFFLNLC